MPETVTENDARYAIDIVKAIHKVRPATLGAAGDAGPFSRADLKATTLLGFGMRQMVAFYHQKWDTPEVLSIEPLLNVLKLTLEWVRNNGNP